MSEHAEPHTETHELFPFTDEEGGLLFATRLPGGARDFDNRLGWDQLKGLAGGPKGDRSGDAGPAEPVWLHLDRTRAHAKQWILEEAGLDGLVAEALLAHESRPRAKEAGDGLLVIMRGVNLNKGAEPDDMIAIRLWLDPTRIITLRQHRFQTVVDLRKRAQAGRAPGSPVGMLVAIASGLASRLGPVVENLQELVDDAEDKLIDEDPDSVRMHDLAEVRRQAISLRRYLAPQRDMLASLAMSPNPMFDERSRAELHEISDRTARVVEDLEEVRDRAAVAQEELRAHRDARNSRTMYLLTLVAAIFLPLGLLTGLLGINVGGMPGADDPHAFWVVTGSLVGLSAGLILVFKKLRWL